MSDAEARFDPVRALPQAVAIGRGGRRAAAAADDEPAAEDRFAEIEFEEMSKIVIKKRAYYQENKLKVYGLLWGLCNPALRACETHRDYPDILLRLDLLSLWRLVTRLCTIGMRDDVDVEERRKAAEQRLRSDRFATIQQFQSETTDDFITRYEREYRAFRTADNELVQSGGEADARVIQAQAEIATRIDGAKTLTS